MHRWSVDDLDASTETPLDVARPGIDLLVTTLLRACFFELTSWNHLCILDLARQLASS